MDRAKSGSKRHLICDGHGISLPSGQREPLSRFNTSFGITRRNPTLQGAAREAALSS